MKCLLFEQVENKEIPAWSFIPIVVTTCCYVGNGCCSNLERCEGIPSYLLPYKYVSPESVITHNPGSHTAIFKFKFSSTLQTPNILLHCPLFAMQMVMSSFVVALTSSLRWQYLLSAQREHWRMFLP